MRRVTEQFIAASASGDLQALLQVLDPNVIGHTDSGGFVPAPRRALVGREQVLAGLLSFLNDYQVTLAPMLVNGEPGAVAYQNGRLIAVLAFEARDGLITRIHGIANPHKLAHVRSRLEHQLRLRPSSRRIGSRGFRRRGSAQRILDLLRGAPLIDGHNDLLWALREARRRRRRREPDIAEPLPSFRPTSRAWPQGGIGGQFWSVFVPSDLPRDAAVTRRSSRSTPCSRSCAATPTGWSWPGPRTTWSGSPPTGRVASMIGVEGGHSIGELARRAADPRRAGGAAT